MRSRSPEETEQIGKRLAAALRVGDVLVLTGQIGSGKTTFVRGLAEGLGISPQAVSSPSFVLVREYPGPLPLYHADLFRLEGLGQALSVGLEECYASPAVTVIEWGTQIPQILPEEFLEVRFEVIDPETRDLTWIPRGGSYAGRAWPTFD